MIEQQNNLLLISFPSPEAEAQAKRWMEVKYIIPFYKGKNKGNG